MLRKLKDNNEGHGALNFAIILLTTLILLCLLLDLMNLFRIKGALINQTDALASAYSYQGGFQTKIPDDWVDTFGNEGKSNYITSSIANARLRAIMNNTTSLKDKSTIKANNKVIYTTTESKLDWKAEAVFSCSVEYYFNYLRVAGLSPEKRTATHSVPVCGFWIHKTTSI